MHDPRTHLLPLLVHIQTHLDQDLSLTALARRAGLSPAYMQRLFLAHIGESPKRYVTRLRLEQAAFRMQLSDTTLLDLALDCGFRSHETFTRSFSRRFGTTPSAYRENRRLAGPRRRHSPPARGMGPLAPQVPFSLSTTRVVRLREVHLAFIRHYGPYEDVPDRLYRDLERWALAQRLRGPRVWMGIGHDAPGTTATHHLRFDAALVVPAPFRGDGRVGYQRLAGGDFAVTTHVGPFASLKAAYETIVPRTLGLRRWELIGLPAVEIYRTTQVNAEHQLIHTDICLPVRARHAKGGP
jgi:AraC family transcriptional regulator